MSHKNYYWRKYKRGDLQKLNMLDDEKEVALQSEDLIERIADQHDAARKFCGTAFWNGQILAIGGWVEIAPGICEGFFVPDKSALLHPIAFTRSFKRWIQYMEDLPWCHRIQSHSLPVKRISDFMTALGFLYEGRVKRYTESEDYNLWSRVKIDGTWGH